MDQKGKNQHVITMKCLHKTTRIHHTLIGRRVKNGMGIHLAQHMMLMGIARSPDPLSQKEIARRMEITEAATTMCLKKLEAEGLITRMISKTDSRRREIAITEKGKKIISDTKLLFSEMDQEALQGFTEQEMLSLCSMLERIQNNLCRALSRTENPDN